MPKDYRGSIKFVRARYQEKHQALKLTKRFLNRIIKYRIAIKSLWRT